MGWLKNAIFKIFKIQPATERQIVIKEPLTFHGNVLKNKVWYRGDPAELEQYFKQIANFDAFKTRFWASVPYRKVRKIHSGIVGIAIDRLKDIMLSDLSDISFGEEGEATPLKDLWGQIAEDNRLNDLLGEAITGSLSSGDGAFKISLDEVSQYPVIEYYEADQVEFVNKRGRLQEILFYTKYPYPENGEKCYCLKETYGKGFVRYQLLDDSGKEVEGGVKALTETAMLEDTEFDGDYIMGVPLIFLKSNKWKGRGKALFDGKTDDLDALDEVISQWLDAVRKGRVNRYIPEDMLPRDPATGMPLEPNEFDNDYIAMGISTKEAATPRIEVVQPEIRYEAYLNSYISFMDLVLQGIISPATLGIDLKKTDNAESQREKEKITMHTRSSLIDVMAVVIAELAAKVMMTYDLMNGQLPGDYEVSVKFGEYAAPDFDTVVETVGKAKGYGVMSTEKAVEELYGDTLTDDEKAEEVARIKNEQGIVDLEEPAVNLEGVKIDEGQDNESDIPDGADRVQENPSDGK